MKYGEGDPEMVGHTAKQEEPTFGLFSEGHHRKLAAMVRHEANAYDLLVPCREYLRGLYRNSLRPVSADDARAWLDFAGIPDSQRGSVMAWMGALFREKEWEAVG